MGTKRNYSITKDKYRFNDDFGLYYKGIDTASILEVNKPIKTIRDDSNWTFSVFHSLEKGGINCLYNDYYGASVTGIFFSYREINQTLTNFTIITNGNLGNSFSEIPITHSNIRYKLLHTVLSYNATTELFSLYINSEFIGTLTRPTQQEFGQTTNPFYVGSRQGGFFTSKGFFRDFCIFDRELTQLEINYIYETGILPNSSHANCQFHMPFNHIPKVDGSNRLMLDVVKNYDYAKVSGATANDGVMSGWTDDELLINKDTTGNLDSGAFRNFYTKNQNGLYGLKMEDLDPSFTAGYFSIPSINTNTPPTTFPNGYSIVVEGDLRRGVNNTNGDNNFYPFFDDGKRYIYVKTIGTNVTVAYTNVNLTTPIMQYFTNSSEKITSIVVTATSGGDFKMYVNGRLVAQTTETYDPLTTTTNRIIFGVPAGNSWYKRFDSIHIYETILNGNDVANGYEYKNWDDKTPYISYKSEFNGADLKELTGNGQDAILQPGAYQWTPNDIIECRSNFETREKGLQLNGSSQYLNIPNFNPTSEKGYTVLCGFSKNDNTPFTGNQTIWSKFQNTTNYFELRGANTTKLISSIYPDGSGSANNIDLTNVDLTKPQFIATKYSKTGDVTIPYAFGLDNKVGYSMNYNGRYENNSPFVNETNLTLGFDEITANDFRIGFRAAYWNGKILYMCVFKGILNDAEIKELYNNGLFRNPSTTLQEKYDLELFVDFNNPFDDGGTLKFPDLSPNSHDIIANGWFNLVDLQNSLLDL